MGFHLDYAIIPAREGIKMKKIIAFVIVVFLVSGALALEFAANFSIKTGDVSLDLALTNVNKQAKSKDGALAIKVELQKDFSIVKADIAYLLKKKYSLAEIYYLALFSKRTGKSIRRIAAFKSRGIGWGTMAKKLKIKPSDLNKLRVSIKQKKAKAVVKAKAKKKVAVKAKTKKK
jgi:hypothetical protein